MPGARPRIEERFATMRVQCEGTILTDRFALHELGEDDATPTYLDWLNPERSPYLSSGSQYRSVDQLRAYIAEKLRRDDVLFLGIFRRSDGAHIGNVKYEPVDIERRFATLGVLIGDIGSRGQGVAGEVIAASGRWLRNNYGIRQILLGVDWNNAAAMRAYEKIGFRISETSSLQFSNPEWPVMCWEP